MAWQVWICFLALVWSWKIERAIKAASRAGPCTVRFFRVEWRKKKIRLCQVDGGSAALTFALG
jgi:hypothetical protein